MYLRGSRGKGGLQKYAWMEGWVVGMMCCSREVFKEWCFTCMYCFLISCDCPFNVLPIISGVNPFKCRIEGGEREERE
jgi:hypothetical protein